MENVEEIEQKENLPPQPSSRRKYLFIGIIVILILLAVGLLLLLFFSRESTQPTPQESIEENIALVLDTEERFNQKKASFQTIEATVGEDATSGYYYTLYKDGDTVQAVRVVWNGGAQSNPTVSYHFFDDEQLVLIKVREGERDDIQKIVEGSDENTTLKEELVFEDSKMSEWRQEGALVSSTDPRWKEQEQASLSSTNFYVNEFEVLYGPKDITASWQAYRNEEFGFEVKIHPNISALEFPNELFVIVYEGEENIPTIAAEFKIYPMRVEGIPEGEKAVFQILETSIPDEEIKLNTGTVVKRENVKLDSCIATQYLVKNEVNEVREYGTYCNLGENQLHFILNFEEEVSSSAKEKAIEFYDQTLSTFRFIE